MAAIYRNYGDFQTPTPVAIGQRAFPNWGSTFSGDLGAIVKTPRFAQYVLERTFHRFNWLTAGAVYRDARLDNATGYAVSLPMVRPFIAEKEIVKSNTTWGASGKGHLTVQKMNADNAIIPMMNFAYAAGADDLSAITSGLDPIGIMAGQTAENVRRIQTELFLSIMEGAFATGGPLATTHVLDATRTGSGTSTGANYLSAATVMKAKALLGERGSNLNILAMHSNVAYSLSVTGMLTFSTDSLVNGGNIQWGGGGVGVSNTDVGLFAGCRVIVDDTLKPTTDATNGDKYPVYLMEAGTLATGIQREFRIEYDRNILSFQNVFAVSWYGGAGIMGLSWKGSTTEGLGEADLKTGTNWENKFADPLNIGLVKILVNSPLAAHP